MVPISIYPPNEVDFSNNGLGFLLPTECSVEEIAGGMYKLTLVHPISADGRWTRLLVGCIIKAPVPVRESPLYEYDADSSGATAVTREIYRVDTPSGQRLHLRQGPSTSSAVLGRYSVGTEVVRLSVSDDWARVTVRDGGATGYMWADYLSYVRTETDAITPTNPTGNRVISVSPARDQLFRISSVEIDSESSLVTVGAEHIFYDLVGNIVHGDYVPDGVSATEAVQLIFTHLLNAHAFTLYADKINGAVSGNYSFRDIVNSLLDPDDGVVAQSRALVVRDNYDVFLLPDEVRDRGVTVRRGKNLVGVTVTTDTTGVITRIVPTGKTAKGKTLYLSDDIIWVDSEHINDYPIIRAKRIEYDVVSGSDEFPNDETARAELDRLAKLEFTENKVDLPAYSMEVDFVMLSGDSSDSYARLQAIHLYDTVTVIDEVIGVLAKLRSIAYEWDVLAQQYMSMTLGDLRDIGKLVV